MAYKMGVILTTYDTLGAHPPSIIMGVQGSNVVVFDALVAENPIMNSRKG